MSKVAAGLDVVPADVCVVATKVGVLAGVVLGGLEVEPEEMGVLEVVC